MKIRKIIINGDQINRQIISKLYIKGTSSFISVIVINFRNKLT